MAERYSHEIGVKTILARELAYLTSEDRYVGLNEDPSGARVSSISGAQVHQEYLAKGKKLPEWVARPDSRKSCSARTRRPAMRTPPPHTLTCTPSLPSCPPAFSPLFLLFWTILLILPPFRAAFSPPVTSLHPPVIGNSMAYTMLARASNQSHRLYTIDSGLPFPGRSRGSSQRMSIVPTAALGPRRRQRPRAPCRPTTNDRQCIR